MNRNWLYRIISTFCFAIILGVASDVSAQITTPTVETKFHFSVPVVLTVSHPCQPSVVAIQAAVVVDLSTLKSTDFRFELGVTGSGTGQPVDASGIPLSGTTPYQFDAAMQVKARFPKGTPAFFAHTLTVDGLLTQPGVDEFALTAVLEIQYNSGVPTMPKLRSIDVSCQ
jgi:hypothetical protein